MNEKHWTLFFDGATEPTNPGGHMTWAFVLQFLGDQERNGSGGVLAAPANTSNVAEWMGLGLGLNVALELKKKHGPPDVLVIHGDSQLVVNQLAGRWRCKAPHLAEYRDRALDVLAHICPRPCWRAVWVPRELNERADQLTRMAYRDLTGQTMPTRHGASWPATAAGGPR